MNAVQRFRDAVNFAAEVDNGDEQGDREESLDSAVGAAQEILHALQYLADQVGDPHEEASADELSGVDLADECLNVLWQLGFFAKYEEVES
jgi:hypothetical protein